MISIIDYGMGNVASLENTINYLGFSSSVVTAPQELSSSTKIIIPGVGSFAKAMQKLHQADLVSKLNELVLEHKVPVLGICLGMQIMAKTGDEGVETAGMSWIPGYVRHLNLDRNKYKTPHVGFNETFVSNNENDMFQGVEKITDFYYTHSYSLTGTDADVAYTIYGKKIVAAIVKDNIWGCQFHPEKSQTNGLQIMKNFLSL